MAYDQTRFAELYNPPYNRAFYSRNWMMYRDRAAILQSIGIGNRDTVLVVGCGLGFLMEHIISDIGCSQVNVWGVDTSPFIATERLTEGREDTRLQIVNADIESAIIRTTLNTLCGISRFGWVVTEDMLPSYTDSQSIQSLLNGCDLIKTGNGKVAHIVSTLIPDGSQDVSLWWRTIDDWSAERPSHYWIDVHGGRVVGGA
jgi:SAM-dependent methyltransferase